MKIFNEMYSGNIIVSRFPEEEDILLNHQDTKLAKGVIGYFANPQVPGHAEQLAGDSGNHVLKAFFYEKLFLALCLGGFIKLEMLRLKGRSG